MSQPEVHLPLGVLIVDFGTQYCQLIARRVREQSVYSEICVPDTAYERFEAGNFGAIILSGGPRSVFEDGSPQLDPRLLEQGVPVLGICYGMQALSHVLGGRVVPAADSAGREYGHAELLLEEEAGPLFKGVEARTRVWMSHGDKVESLPEGFVVAASSVACPMAASYDPARRLYAIQFHPEVAHTDEGSTMLRNFLFDIAQLPSDWAPGNIAEMEIQKIRDQVGEEGEVVLGLSGGVDSSVAALLLHHAIGPRLHCVFVDNGLLRLGERQAVEQLYARHFEMDLHVVDASELFLGKLEGVSDPEEKRKIIGHVFVDVFREKAKEFTNAHFLGQGYALSRCDRVGGRPWWSHRGDQEPPQCGGPARGPGDGARGAAA